MRGKAVRGTLNSSSPCSLLCLSTRATANRMGRGYWLALTHEPGTWQVPFGDYPVDSEEGGFYNWKSEAQRLCLSVPPTTQCWSWKPLAGWPPSSCSRPQVRWQDWCGHPHFTDEETEAKKKKDHSQDQTASDLAVWYIFQLCVHWPFPALLKIN